MGTNIVNDPKKSVILYKQNGEVWCDYDGGTGRLTIASLTSIIADLNVSGEVDTDYITVDGAWEDLRFPANGISIGGLTTPPDVDPETGLLLFDGAGAAETIAVLAQMPHSWLAGSSVRPHIHWKKTTDQAGDAVFTFRYKLIEFDELETAWSSIFNATDVNTVDATQKDIISSFPEIDMTGYGLSSMILIQLGRLSSDVGDTYPADIELREFDIHYQVDSFGSRQEFMK